jgi:hypothetical protein
LKNIEETEAAKKQLQEKRLASKTKSDLSIPASYSADYLHRGRDYAEKLRRGKIFSSHFHICFVFNKLVFVSFVSIVFKGSEKFV